ncbi:MAG: hypothetical protein HY270_15725 [Deltaproteobacteria bacterium]|nr:hypothetical protein [Deltaproteobacteria bacterium]
MSNRLATLLRLLNRLLSLVAALLLAAAIAACLTAYLAIHGPNMPLLRRGLTALDRLFSGQSTQRLTTDVRLEPATATLSATTKLTVQSHDDGRQRFYFLLNPGLRLHQARATDADGGTLNAVAYRLWGLLIVDIGRPLQKEEHFDLQLTYGGVPLLDVLGGANQLNVNEVMLNVDAFWYPVDTQSFFSADVRVTLPANLTLVYHGAYDSRSLRGNEQQVHWESERPVAGVALIAGRYAQTTRESGGALYRVYLADDVHLDAERILQSMVDTDHFFSERFGRSAFQGSSLFVNRSLRRGFNDGSGVIGLSVRYFRNGDYAFALVAHEMAHNWWGATVAGGWLSNGTGAQWIVEGLAECSSLMATENAFGPEALARRMPSELFDPARQAAIADMTVLDNALAEPIARDTIYRKGAWAACMLRQVIGDEPFTRGLRHVIELYRMQHITERNVQRVLEEASGQPLETYFNDWLRSDRLLDLSLDQNATDELVVNNQGKVAAPHEIALWTYKKGAQEPLRSTVEVGDKLHIGSDVESLVLDPQLQWADVERENNRYPRHEDPFAVAVSATSGSIAVAQGSPLAWSRAAVRSIDSSGATTHTWELERGLLQPPAWSADGKLVVASNSAADRPLPFILSLAGDGARRTVGRGINPAPAAAATIYAAQDDRLLRFSGGTSQTLMQRRGMAVEQPLPSPDGKLVVYTQSKHNRSEVRLMRADGGDDRSFLSWDRDRMVLRWAPDSSRLYAVVGGDWDWQVWELPLDDTARVLARGAAAIGDLAVSPDGKRLAVSAAATIDYPSNRRQLIVMNLEDQSVRTIDMPDSDVSNVAWLGTNNILAITVPSSSSVPWGYPERRSLQRVDIDPGSAQAWP